jgi:hypothetical protein
MAHERVLDRIDVTVLDVTRVICVVSNQVLPKTPLPNSALAAGTPYSAQLLPLGIAFAKRDLINRQRVEKSASSTGKVNIACMWSGKTTKRRCERHSVVA